MEALRYFRGNEENNITNCMYEFVLCHRSTKSI